MDEIELHRYPKTHHLDGSGTGTSKHVESFDNILDKLVVVEEKMDGSNSAISFDNGKLLLQSRGHYLSGGPREAQFSLFKAWAWERRDWLYKKLSDTYVMYGECLSYLHTMFYDKLPSCFMEFDLYDKETGEWLSTYRRRKLLYDTPSVISPVRVLHIGRIENKEHLLSFIGPSAFMSENWEENLKKQCGKKRNFKNVLRETDKSKLMEGLYIKVEGGYYSTEFGEYNTVDERYKFVRKDFLDVVKESGSHWFDRPLIRNMEI